MNKNIHLVLIDKLIAEQNCNMLYVTSLLTNEKKDAVKSSLEQQYTQEYGDGRFFLNTPQSVRRW